MYVLGLKKNLVLVSMIEDRGFSVYVLDGKVHIFPKAAGPSDSWVIGIRCGKLYKLLFEPHHALSHTQSSSELCELWHRSMAHLHHPALRMLREMTTCMPELNTESSGVCRGCALGKYTKTAFAANQELYKGIKANRDDAMTLLV